MSPTTAPGAPASLHNDVATAVFTSKIPLQPDDAADSLLMHCCAALTAVGNRALCPKELAELCMKRGWTCSGSQPFAIISSAIRAHLRRRGITTSNASNGLPPAQGKPAPLFTSYELTGPVAPEDVEAIGIVKAERPAIKRGTLWYLSVHGTGVSTPFAPGRDPLAHLKHLKHALPAPPPPPTSSIAHATPPSPERMPTRRGSRPSFSYHAAIAAEMESHEDDDEMGRGKRKRKASGISGGEWESIALPTTSVTASTSVVASTLARIAEEPAGALWTPRPVMAQGSVVKLKLRLPAPGDPSRARPALAVPASLVHDVGPLPSSDDETADESEELDFARRKRLRFRPGQDVSSAAAGPYRNPRPAFGTSTSVIDDDDSASDDDDDVVSVQDERTEAMLRAADFDFEFSHAFSAPLQSGLAELGHLALDNATVVSTPATTPRYIEEPSLAGDKKDDEAIEVDGEEKEDEEDNESTASAEEIGAELLRGRERRRAVSAGALDAPAPFNINATLCPERPASGRGRSRSYEGIVLPTRAVSEGPSSETERFSSPAPPLPLLSVVAATDAFAPAGLKPIIAHIVDSEPPCQTPYGFPDELDYDFSIQLAESSHASLAASPRSPEYPMSEQGADDFDPESVLPIASRGNSGSASPLPSVEEDALSEGAGDSGVFMRGFGDSMLSSMDLDAPEAVGLDVLDREFGPDEEGAMASLAVPPFGSAASFFTSFLGSASVPVSVVGLRRDSDTSYDSEAVTNEASESESEDEAPPARSTRSSARAVRAARRQRPTVVVTRKRSTRRNSTTS